MAAFASTSHAILPASTQGSWRGGRRKEKEEVSYRKNSSINNFFIIMQTNRIIIGNERGRYYNQLHLLLSRDDLFQ
jgi:hypothetical protein